MARPLVVVDHAVSGVGEGGERGGEDEEETREGEEDEEGSGWVEGVGAGEVYGDGEGYYEVGGELGERGAVGEAVGCVLLGAVVGGRGVELFHFNLHWT